MERDIPVEELLICDIEDFHARLRTRRNGQGVPWIYRGQADASWDLKPKAGRAPYLLRATFDNHYRDLGRFQEWREQVYPFARDLPTNDFEALAYAQHHGLATRLLDWTSNPLVAALFAARDEKDKDGALYCYTPPDIRRPDGGPLPIPGTVLAEEHEALYAGGIRRSGAGWRQALGVRSRTHQHARSSTHH